jgi:hypothetical protein
MNNVQMWNTYEYWNSYQQHDIYEQWRNGANFSYFTNRDHFGIQAALNQLKYEKKLITPKGPPGPPVFYHVPPLGFYQPQPPQVERNILSDLNIKATPWTPEVSPTTEKSFFDFKESCDVLLE